MDKTLAMSENERRTGAKLHKQPEVEDDDGDDSQEHHSDSSFHISQHVPSLDLSVGISTESIPDSSIQTSTPADGIKAKKVPSSNVNVSGVRTPTIQSASSSSETSPDEGQAQVNAPITRKQTLTRTQALEGTSPPPESFVSQQSRTECVGSSLDVPGYSLTNGGGSAGAGQDSASGLAPSSSSSPGHHHKKVGQSLSQEAKEYLLLSHKTSNDSGHGTLDTTDGGSDTSVLSRDSSLENSAANMYKDSSGVNIPRFIRETMLKSSKDKKTVLTYEKQLIDFCRNENSQVLKMAEASSYDRMIAHRLSAFMGLEHNVDSTGKSVIIHKTENMRKVKITDFIKLDDSEQDTKKKILLKKPASLDEKHSRGANKGQFGSHRAKSLEERQQIYSEARERIFKDGENQTESSGAPSLLSVQQPPHNHRHLHPGCWTSQDSAVSRYSQGAADLRASTMVKSNSYGGVGSDPYTVPGLIETEPSCAISRSSADSQKDPPSLVYGHPPGQSSAPPPVVPLGQSMAGVIPEPPVTQQQISSEERPPSQNMVQPHVNADGSLYQFDPSCPPPFMAQPLVQPSAPAGHLTYQMENLSMSDMSGKFAGQSLEPASGVTGQLVMAHPQASLTYPSSHPPIQLSQAQYYPSMSPSLGAAIPGQTQYQVLAYTPIAPAAAQGHQLAPQAQMLQASPLEAQGQATVPMPSVGVPGVAGTTLVLGPPPYDISAGAAGAGGVAMYAAPAPYPSCVESLGAGTAGGAGSGIVTGPLPQQQQQHQPQLVQYSIPVSYSQPQHHLQQQHQSQIVVPHSVAGHPAYFTAIQAAGSTSTPTPPPPPLPPPHHPGLSLPQHPPPPPHQQIPPSSSKASPQPHLNHQQQQQQQQQQQVQPHHQHQQQQPQQQPTVFFSPGLGNLTVSPLAQSYANPVSSNPQASSSIVMTQPSSSTTASNAALKPGAVPYFQYRSSPPPPPPMPPPHHLQHHHPHQQQIVAARSNSSHLPHLQQTQQQPTHHSPQQQLTLNCGQPVSLNPSSGSGPASASRPPQQLVAYHQGRPVGTIIHVGGRAPPFQPSVQPLVQPSPVGPPQLQPYQIFRPATQDLRMMNPASIRPRLASLQLSTPNSQQAHSKPQYKQQRKGSKRVSSEVKDIEDPSSVPGGGNLHHQAAPLGCGPAVPGGSGLSHSQHQQPLIVAPLIPGMVGHPHIPPASSHR